MNDVATDVKHVNVVDAAEFRDSAVRKVPNIKTDQMGVDTYYFRPGQVLEYHRHPGSDQVFFILQGEGKFYLDDGAQEVSCDVKTGSVVLAPAGIWHKLVNTGRSDLIAAQATNLPATVENRD